MKIVSVIGARPQFIKAAPTSRAIRKKHEEVMVHTGQHYDDEMSDVFFRTMGIPEPDYNLEVGSGTHAWQTAKMMTGIEEVLEDERPDWLLVYGDTNSTIAGALAAIKLHIPVAHVEAGLRSFNMKMPEEVNRRLTDHISTLLFCPTRTAVDNLAGEGITEGVHLVGDVMLDAANHYSQMPTDILERLALAPKEYFLLTVHRPVNTDDERNLCAILNSLKGRKTIFPAHPRTTNFMTRFHIEPPDSVQVTKPVNYIEMLALIKNAKKVLTDSGGMQKEAYFMGTPCITLRNETEWVETIEDGWNMLAGADCVKIKEAIENFEPTGERGTRYGDGNAAEKIVKIMEDY